MTAGTEPRDPRVQELLERAEAWARRHSDVVALLLVGSHAAGRAREDSDVDLVLVTTDREGHLARGDFIDPIAPGSTFVREGDWGPMREHRVRLDDGLEVEFGLTGPAWLALPLDPGTERVLRDGCLLVHDTGPAARALASLGDSP